MSDDKWLEIIARAVPNAPVDLDPILLDGPAPSRAPVRQVEGRAPAAQLWDRSDGDRSYFGVRVRNRAVIDAGIAVRLAAAAVERKVVPIILSHVPNCGFERFGFRVEFVGGKSKAQRQSAEEELRRFWDMAIVIDLDEVIDLR